MTFSLSDLMADGALANSLMTFSLSDLMADWGNGKQPNDSQLIGVNGRLGQWHTA